MIMTPVNLEKSSEMQSPAPRWRAEDRADCLVEQHNPTVKSSDMEEFAANFIGHRYGLSPTLARVVAELALLGGRFT